MHSKNHAPSWQTGSRHSFHRPEHSPSTPILHPWWPHTVSKRSCPSSSGSNPVTTEQTTTSRQYSSSPTDSPSSSILAPQLASSSESGSAASWLSQLDDVQLQQQAHDWGFTQIGRPLPEGVSVTAIADILPEEDFHLDLVQAFGRLAMSIAIMAAGYWYLWYMHSICPVWQQLLCWLVIGTGYFGVFQTATDCAHFAFHPEEPLFQDVLGATLMAPSLFSFETWRLKYFNHLLYCNMLEEDTDAWHPIRTSDLLQMHPIQQALTRLILGTPLKLFASIGKWLRSWDGFDLKLYRDDSKRWILLSWAVPFAFMGTVWPAMFSAGGLSGWASWWLMPWLVFHGWLSLITLMQHTAPHIPWVREVSRRVLMSTDGVDVDGGGVLVAVTVGCGTVVLS
eukprot:jgi/Chrzof1/2589/Cz11g21120.t1_FAD6B[v5.2]